MDQQMTAKTSINTDSGIIHVDKKNIYKACTIIFP